jgi:hypothetical protein
MEKEKVFTYFYEEYNPPFTEDGIEYRDLFLWREDEDGNPIYEDDEADAINLLQGLGYVIYKPATEEEVVDDADADEDADAEVDDDFAGEDDEDF